MNPVSSPMTFTADTSDRAPPFAGGWRGALDRRWHPVELASMIVGFVVFWPIGLAILGWKKWTGAARSLSTGHGNEPTLGHDTGNSAFEAFKRSELERLEAERQKLHQAEADFGHYLERLKQARDREEFDRFMGERADGQAGRPAA